MEQVHEAVGLAILAFHVAMVVPLSLVAVGCKRAVWGDL